MKALLQTVLNNPGSRTEATLAVAAVRAADEFAPWVNAS